MHFNPFYKNYSAAVKSKDPVMAKDIITSEIADAILSRKDEVIDALNHSGLYVDSSVTTKELSAIASDNLSNPKFIEGISAIISEKYPQDAGHYSSANGGKSSGSDYRSNVFMAVSGSVAKGDAAVLEKVEIISPDTTEQEKSAKTGGFILAGLLSFCALSLYLIGIKKVI